MLRPIRLLVTVVAGLVLVVAGGCGGAPKPQPEPATGTATDTASGDAAPAGAAVSGSALDTLKAKLLPPGGEPPPKAGAGARKAAAETRKKTRDVQTLGPPLEDPELIAGVQALVRDFVAALEAGDKERSLGLLISDDEISAVASPGHRRILVGNLTPINRRTVSSLVEQLGGQKLEWKWDAGALHHTSPQTFQHRMPILSGGALELRAGDALVVVRDVSLLWVEGRWRFFKLEL